MLYPTSLTLHAMPCNGSRQTFSRCSLPQVLVWHLSASHLLLKAACYVEGFCSSPEKGAENGVSREGTARPIESHYEAAWRMQQWTHVETDGISENAAVPFHQAFCGCLKVRASSGITRQRICHLPTEQLMLAPNPIHNANLMLQC